MTTIISNEINVTKQWQAQYVKSYRATTVDTSCLIEIAALLVYGNYDFFWTNYHKEQSRTIWAKRQQFTMTDKRARLNPVGIITVTEIRHNTVTDIRYLLLKLHHLELV